MPGAVAAIYSLLEPFGEQERINIVRATLAIFGQSFVERAPGSSQGGGNALASLETDLPPKAARWAEQNGITDEMLENVFFLEPTPAEVVATVPGKNAQEKTVNCYVLTGLAAFLKSDEGSFSDSDARSLCEHVGCYDSTNHSKRLAQLGNRVAGSKAKGWKLLGPGLKAGADLIKSMGSDQ